MVLATRTRMTWLSRLGTVTRTVKEYMVAMDVAFRKIIFKLT
jgi:hypothetical protein